MNKYEIVKRIEKFAPTELAQDWDCVGFMVETPKIEINKIMLCLTPTDDVISQAKVQNCDMIVSHHPLFYIPNNWSIIDIYSAHTNMDLAKGGTTDILLKTIIAHSSPFLKMRGNLSEDFVRYAEFSDSIQVEKFASILRKISPNLRYINNKGVKTVRKIGFCAGSGSEFIKQAQEDGADCFVTGDLKFHTALDSEIVVFDIGHFESEILILPVFKEIIGKDVETVYADEKSPFIY